MLVTDDPFEWTGRVGQNWARAFARTDRSFAGLTEVLIERTLALSPARLLDIGCGAGETSIVIGRQSRKTDILGIDLSEQLVAEARHRRRALKNVRFDVANAATWRDQAFVPDTLMSRHGVMFFEKPVDAFANLQRASARGAQLIFSCFRDRQDNQWATAIADLLDNGPSPADPTAPGPFAFADKTHVTRILVAAGWEKIAFEPVDWDYVAGDGADPVRDAVAFFQKIGPAAAAIAGLAGEEREASLAKIANLATKQLRNGRVVFKASAWVVTAQAVMTVEAGEGSWERGRRIIK